MFLVYMLIIASLSNGFDICSVLQRIYPNSSFFSDFCVFSESSRGLNRKCRGKSFSKYGVLLMQLFTDTFVGDCGRMCCRTLRIVLAGKKGNFVGSFKRKSLLQGKIIWWITCIIICNNILILFGNSNAIRASLGKSG